MVAYYPLSSRAFSHSGYFVQASLVCVCDYLGLFALGYFSSLLYWIAFMQIVMCFRWLVTIAQAFVHYVFIHVHTA
jgi:hypothetical protein